MGWRVTRYGPSMWSSCFSLSAGTGLHILPSVQSAHSSNRVEPTRMTRPISAGRSFLKLNAAHTLLGANACTRDTRAQRRSIHARAPALSAPRGEASLQRRLLGRSTTTRAASPCNAVVTRATLGCWASRSPIACFKTPLPWPVIMRTATVPWACSRRKKASVRCNASRRRSPCRSSVGSLRLGGSLTRASMVLRCAMRDHNAPDSGGHK